MPSFASNALAVLVTALTVTAQMSYLDIKAVEEAENVKECEALGGVASVRGIEFPSATTQFFFIYCGSLVFFMQAGFALLEAGSVQKVVTVNILFKNLADVLVGAFVWWTLGYAFAYGKNGSSDLPKDQNDFIGNSGYFLQNIGFCEYSFYFYQWTFAATAVTIVSGAVAGRTQLKAYMGYSILLIGFVYPTVVKWTWSYNGWLWQGTNTDGEKVFEAGEDNMGYRDFAGSGIVHVLGGTAALVGAWMVGPRVGWTKEDGITGHSMPLVFLGTMILSFGFIGFNGGSVLAMDTTSHAAGASLAVVNTILAGSGGGVVMEIWSRGFDKKWSMVTMCNSALAGMVAVCAGADSYWPWAAWIVGMCGGLGFRFVSRMIRKAEIDDAIDACGVHLGGGMVGVLLRPFFDKADGLFYGHGVGWTMLGWNIAGLVVIVVWTGAWMYLLFKILSVTGNLRVSDAEQAGPGGIDAHEHGEDSYSLNDWKPNGEVAAKPSKPNTVVPS